MYRKHSLPGLITALLVTVNSVAVAEQPAANVSAVLSKKQAAALELTASTFEDHLRLAVYYRAQERKFEERVRYQQEMAA